MTFKTYEINVDLVHDTSTTCSNRFSQNDRNSAKLLVTITNKGAELDLSQAKSVRMSFKKPDGTRVFQNDCQPINAMKGKYQIVLKTQTLTSVGNVIAQIHIEEEDRIIDTQKFFFVVNDSLASDEAVESTNEFTIIQKAIEAGKKLEGKDIDGIIAAGAKADAALVEVNKNKDQIGILSGNVATNTTNLTNKVDKVEGKGLSTNDYDNTEKTEVAKIKNKADKTYADSIQTQVNNLVVNSGNADAEVSQAHGDTTGANHSTLHERISNIENNVAMSIETVATSYVKTSMQLTNTGTLVGSAAYHTYDKVPVNENDSLFISGFCGNGAGTTPMVVGYDSKQAFVSVFFTPSAITQYTDKRITIPSGVKYVSVSFRVDGSGSLTYSVKKQQNLYDRIVLPDGSLSKQKLNQTFTKSLDDNILSLKNGNTTRTGLTLELGTFDTKGANEVANNYLRTPSTLNIQAGSYIDFTADYIGIVYYVAPDGTYKQVFAVYEGVTQSYYFTRDGTYRITLRKSTVRKNADGSEFFGVPTTALAAAQANIIFTVGNLPFTKRYGFSYKSVLLKKYIARVGIEFNLYFDKIFQVNRPKDYYVTATSSGLTFIVTDKYIRLTPTAGQVSANPYTVKLQLLSADGTEISYEYFNLYVLADNTVATTDKAIFIGDSLTDNSLQKSYVDFVKEQLPNMSFYGTRPGVNGVNAEGRASWSTTTYMSSASYGGMTNAFFNPSTSTFDFSYYITNNPSFNDVTLVGLFLGQNDGYRDEAFTNLEAMIQSIHAYKSNIKIYIFMTNFEAADRSPDVFKTRLEKTQKYIDLFGNRENEFIYLVPQHVNLDSFYDYGHGQVQLSARNTETVLGITDGVHPNLAGRAKEADVFVSCYKYYSA
ncbi:BppU family phage baseplate upper protein [Bacillus cereus group sp. MYBK69-2]|uniref:SGNH/GDSL hydrolase family protein n=1 Tax=unclassified Bacillus cereus group TaxID=2750818 RepID=UPI003F78F6FB